MLHNALDTKIYSIVSFTVKVKTEIVSSNLSIDLDRRLERSVLDVPFGFMSSLLENISLKFCTAISLT